MLTLNQNVVVGDSVFHVQTEPYRASGKVVSNILRDGIVVKRVEKDIPPDAGEKEINQLVRALHASVVAAITREFEKSQTVRQEGVKEEKVSEEKETVFTLPEEIKRKLEDYASNYVGFYAPALVESVMESSHTLEEFLDRFKKELEDAEDIDDFLKKVFKKYIFDLSISVEDFGVNFRETLNRELLEEILSKEFGFLAPQVADEIQEELEKATTFEEAIEIVKSKVEEEKTKELIEKAGKKLFRI